MAVKSSMTEGAAIGQTDLYTRLKDFIENDAGWTVQDDSDPEDVYFNSMGTGAIAGDRRMNIRVSLNEKGMKAPGWCQGKKGIFVRGSCDSSEIFPFGDFEAILKRSNYFGVGDYTQFYKTLPVSPGADWVLSAHQESVAASGSLNTACWVSSNNGKWYGYQISGTQQRFRAFWGKQISASAYSTFTFPTTSTSFLGCLADTDGASYHYQITMDGVLRRVCLNTSVIDVLATAPWGVSTGAMGSLCWDGDDLIYAARGDNTTSFAAYHISTDTWTPLANLPQARSTTNAASARMIYVSTEATGLSNRIYWHINANNVAHFYYYDVDTDTWSAALAAPPVTTYSNAYANWWYFGEDEMLATISSNTADRNLPYRYDILGDSWSVVPLHPLAAASSNSNFAVIPTPWNQGFLGLPATGDIDYWFVGDEDSVTVVTAHYLPTNQPIYQFSFFGRYTPDKNSARYTPTAAISPGSAVDVILDDASNVHIGETWPIVDPSNGTYERVFVQNKVGSTVTLRTVVNSFTSGSFFSQDPYPFLITNGMAGSVPLWPSGDKNVHGITPWVLTIDPDFSGRTDLPLNNATNGAVRVKQPVTFAYENVEGGDEVCGRVPGFYILPAALPYGNPSQIAGEDYLVFQPEEGRVHCDDTQKFNIAIRLV